MIVVDVETTGVDPNKHSIVSIGALELGPPSHKATEGQGAPEDEFYGECRVWDGAHISDEALAVNGFERSDITDPTKQSLEVLMRAFLSWAREVENHMLAGHNVWFDLIFLKSSAYRYGLDWFLSDRLIDIHALAYMHMIARDLEPPTEKGRSAINSSFIQKYVGIPEEPTPHNALTGAKVSAEAISRLLYDKKLLDEYMGHDIPWLGQSSGDEPVSEALHK